jgi:phage-related holin
MIANDFDAILISPCTLNKLAVVSLLRNMRCSSNFHDQLILSKGVTFFQIAIFYLKNNNLDLIAKVLKIPRANS